MLVCRTINREITTTRLLVCPYKSRLVLLHLLDHFESSHALISEPDDVFLHAFDRFGTHIIRINQLSIFICQLELLHSCISSKWKLPLNGQFSLIFHIFILLLHIIDHPISFHGIRTLQLHRLTSQSNHILA